MSGMNSLTADLRQVVHALSDALDLVGVDDVAHGKRVGLMAAECARGGGWPDEEAEVMFSLGLLHDIGVSSTRIHTHLVEQFDWEGSQAHCDVGHALLRGFAPFVEMARPVLYHHTRWDALAEFALPPAVARQANLIHLVDRVDALALPYHAEHVLLEHSGEIRACIAEHAGSYFSPELVELFLEVSRAEAFWLMLEPRSTPACVQDVLRRGRRHLASLGELRQLADLFARIVDAKSPFTAAHSLGVARLARFLARRMGVREENCDKLEIAGLLHDLGKLRVPDEILEKPAALDERERRVINTHSFGTFLILRGIDGFEEITRWAAWHHEQPDGQGYPFHLKGEDLPLEARILRVADIFQAMVQDRPYRAGLPLHDVCGFMAELAAQGRIDAAVNEVLLDVAAEALEIARPVFPPLPGGI